jgi:hypothetical protein
MRKYRLTIHLNEQLSGFLQHSSVNLPSGPDPILETWSGLQQRYPAEYKLAVNVNACEFWKGRRLNPRLPQKPLSAIYPELADRCLILRIQHRRFAGTDPISRLIKRLRSSFRERKGKPSIRLMLTSRHVDVNSTNAITVFIFRCHNQEARDSTQSTARVEIISSASKQSIGKFAR